MSVPVIAMSAFFSEADRKRMHHTDFRACLPKPFTPDKGHRDAEILDFVGLAVISGKHTEDLSIGATAVRRLKRTVADFVIESSTTGTVAPIN
jgi:hypothetical protein